MGSSSKRWRRMPNSPPVSHLIPAVRRKKATTCHRLRAGDSIRVADSPEVSSAVPTAAVPELFAGLTADRSAGHGAAGAGVGVAAGAEVGVVEVGVAGATDGTSAGIAAAVRVGAAAGVAAAVVG